MKYKSKHTYRLLLLAAFIYIPFQFVFAQKYHQLNDAVIVVDQDNTFHQEAAEYLQDQIFQRSGVSLLIKSSITDEENCSIILGQADNYFPPSGLSVPAKKESFAIWTDKSNSAPKIMLIGRDNRGILFAAGALLKLLYLNEDHVSISSDIQLSSSPADKVRAQQIIKNTQCEDGFFDWDKEPASQSFVNDMIIAGVNGFEPTEPSLVDDYLEGLGLGLFVKLKCQDIIDLHKRDDKGIKSFYGNISGIDHITTYGGDASGSVKPQLFFPYMGRVVPLLLQENEGAKWWYSNQCLEDHAKDEDAYIFNYIRNERPPWLHGMVYGPWTKRGIKEIREDLPAQYALRHFPEICHPRWCQYPVPEWDRIFSIVWPRNNSIYMMPTMMTDIYKATRTLTNGSLPYNHTGSYNDLNKFTWASIAWDPEASVEKILSAYSRAFFAYDFKSNPIQDNPAHEYSKEELIDAATQYVVEGLLLLEQNWQGPLKENASTEAALKHWETIAKCIGGPDKNWRVEMFLYKARIDAQIKRKYDMEISLEEEALNILEEANSKTFKKAIKQAEKVLDKIDSEFQSKKDFLKELEALGLSEKFGDLEEITENIYTSFNNRYWIIDQLEKSSSLEDLGVILHYEDAGEGGYYDNLGVAGEQPHLVRKYEWKDDPGFVYSNIDWVNNKADSDLRHSMLTSVVSRYTTPLQMKWDELDRSSSYSIRIVYNGPFGIKVKCMTDDGILIHDYIEQTGEDILSFSIPGESTADGQLLLEWTQDTTDIKRGVSVSEIWLKEDKIKAEHAVVYNKPGRFAGWPANCGAEIFPGDEIVTGFIEAKYVLNDGHNIEEPYTDWLARSIDGGKTWTAEDPVNYVGDFGDQPNLKTLDQAINFQSPKFMMRMVGTAYHGASDPNGHFFYSMDEGRSWEGPYGFGPLRDLDELKKYNLTELTPRTDYIVTGKHECLLFISAREKGVFGSDRLFCVKTTDGGQSFKFLSWVVKPYEKSDIEKVKLYKEQEKNPFATQCRAVMSSSLGLNDGTIVSAIRRKYIIKGGRDEQWIDLYSSSDGGKTWAFQSMISDTGPSNGNPPALEVCNDGRLCVAYGDRSDGKVKVRYSNDKGISWSGPLVLMDGFWSADMEFSDMGYPRLLKRDDGKMVAIFYYSTKDHLHHIHAAIWDPKQNM